LVSFPFNKIELECEYDPDPQLYDLVPNFESMLTLVSLPSLDPFPELTLIPVPIDLEIESPILGSHIPLMKNECEFNFFDLEPTIEPKPTLEPKLDFSELVLIHDPFILEPKSTIPPSHILLLDQGIDHNDSKIIFQDWSYNRDYVHDRIVYDPIQSRGGNTVNRKEVIKGGFHEPPPYLDWAATLDPIRPPPEPPP